MSALLVQTHTCAVAAGAGPPTFLCFGPTLCWGGSQVLAATHARPQPEEAAVVGA